MGAVRRDRRRVHLLEGHGLELFMGPAAEELLYPIRINGLKDLARRMEAAEDARLCRERGAGDEAYQLETLLAPCTRSPYPWVAETSALSLGVAYGDEYAGPSPLVMAAVHERQRSGNATDRSARGHARRLQRTDKVPVYPRVIDKAVPGARHITEQYQNNPVEADHGRLKARLRPKRGLKRRSSLPTSASSTDRTSRSASPSTNSPPPCSQRTDKTCHATDQSTQQRPPDDRAEPNVRAGAKALSLTSAGRPGTSRQP